MISPQLILDINRELIGDNFAGGGGASSGIEEALGRPVDHAINHDEDALGMHRINHPQTVHHCENVWDIDPAKLARGRRFGFGWFSPDCKHFSKAKGGKPLNKNIRGLVFVMLKWAKIHTRVMVMENVEEIQTYGPLLQHPGHKEDCTCGKPCGNPDPKHKGRTWQALLDALGQGLDPNHPDLPEISRLLNGSVTREELIRGFGYQVETREIRACNHGAPTIRKRLFMICRCDGRPIVWPEDTFAAPEEVKQSCLKPYRTIAECIDWDIPCPSIFLTRVEALHLRRHTGIACNRPLKKATLRRIARGIDRHVLKAKQPFIISLTHQGGDRTEPVDEPAKTITAARRGEKAIVQPQCAAPFVSDANRPLHERSAPANQPLRTLCAGVKGGHFQLISPILSRQFGQSVGQAVTKPGPTVMPGGQGKTAIVAASMVKLRGDAETHAPGHSVTEPGHTSSAGGKHHALNACYLAQHNTGVVGHPATKPISTITGRGTQQQIVAASCTAYYGSEKDGQFPSEPARSITTKPRLALTQAEAAAPLLTDEQIAGAHRVAKFLRLFGIQFEGEFATVCGLVIFDIGMRMLTARELFRAQGFAEGYVIDRAWLVNPKTGEITEKHLKKEAQIRMCGNSVSPPVARAITAANVPELCVWNRVDKIRFFRKRDRKPVFA